MSEHKTTARVDQYDPNLYWGRGRSGSPNRVKILFTRDYAMVRASQPCYVISLVRSYGGRSRLLRVSSGLFGGEDPRGFRLKQGSFGQVLTIITLNRNSMEWCTSHLLDEEQFEYQISGRYDAERLGRLLRCRLSGAPAASTNERDVIGVFMELWDLLHVSSGEGVHEWNMFVSYFKRTHGHFARS